MSGEAYFRCEECETVLPGRYRTIDRDICMQCRFEQRRAVNETSAQLAEFIDLKLHLGVRDSAKLVAGIEGLVREVIKYQANHAGAQ